MTNQTLLNQLINSVQQYKGRIIDQPTLLQAGVLMAITDELDPHLILTRRAAHLSKHSGEVAFAGGKRDDTDPDIVFTALREAHEEIDLSIQDVTVIGQLDQVVSRFGYVVTPIVGIIPADITFTANLDELDAVFKVPLRFFLETEPHDYFERGSFSIPSFHYDGFRIWGLTAMMITEMVNNHLNGTISIRF
ncbi:MAG: CoA pyrophosphatase [Oleispira antarctica]|uniref:NUDIX hydrolase n=1 Tax=Oleispira antarctica RB-8 TaxID=698738 RepID=R4YPH6_OLEAN|nr:CoA pyrophosphatase [Oleispira antarctica]MBQ0791843.1 CoA pyrophosphatase [Oleispira antarctica]CCK77026.1 NUDIX hydrolase [Oleispira antarctica RB-8]|tara:strand:+ start:1353 stop:1928 length:576 start_codon:yes stop_codon:yes gene_type:complete